MDSAFSSNVLFHQIMTPPLSELLRTDSELMKLIEVMPFTRDRRTRMPAACPPRVRVRDISRLQKKSVSASVITIF